MDRTAVEKWSKVKAALEAVGKTDSDYYRRACEVVKTGNDLGPKYK